MKAYSAALGLLRRDHPALRPKGRLKLCDHHVLLVCALYSKTMQNYICTIRHRVTHCFPNSVLPACSTRGTGIAPASRAPSNRIIQPAVVSDSNRGLFLRQHRRQHISSCLGYVHGAHSVLPPRFIHQLLLQHELQLCLLAHGSAPAEPAQQWLLQQQAAAGLPRSRGWLPEPPRACPANLGDPRRAHPHAFPLPGAAGHAQQQRHAHEQQYATAHQAPAVGL